MIKNKGKIIKAISGFFYVAIDKDIYECNARGILKKNGDKLLVGDNVEIEIISNDKKLANIINLYPRKNKLIRPAISNIDQMVVVMALSYPKPDFQVLDKIIINSMSKNIPIIILFNKAEESDEKFISYIKNSYSQTKLPIIFTSAIHSDLNELRVLLDGKLSILSGNSGVGKSTIINKLLNCNMMETGNISHKIKRGKHTTKHTEIFKINNNTFIADTPGYGRFDLINISRNELKKYYTEFNDINNCYFSECSHTHEPSCGVKLAVDKGIISRLRYDNYKKIYEELEE